MRLPGRSDDPEVRSPPGTLPPEPGHPTGEGAVALEAPWVDPREEVMSPMDQIMEDHRTLLEWTGIQTHMFI